MTTLPDRARAAAWEVYDQLTRGGGGNTMAAAKSKGVEEGYILGAESERAAKAEAEGEGR